MLELLKGLENIKGLNINKLGNSLSIQKVKNAYSKNNKIRIYINDDKTYNLLVKVNDDYIECLNLIDVEFIINFIDRI